MEVEGLLGAAPRYPRRIVCMTEETTETLYRIGAGDLVVGISGFTVRPREARAKPMISTFLEARFDDILALKPDLVLGFSDLQADLAAELVRRGVAVHLFNQRSVSEILQAIRLIGALVGRAEAAEALAEELARGVAKRAEAAERIPSRPRVFFEEWPEPLITGIRWVSELIEIAGGIDVCEESRVQKAAPGRVYDPAEVARRDPEAIIGSWCGRMVKPEEIRARRGWEEVSAVRSDQIYEIASAEILQPGPAALTDGLRRLCRIVAAVARGEKLPRRREDGARRAD